MDDVKAIVRSILDGFHNSVEVAEEGGGYRIDTGFTRPDGSGISIRLRGTDQGWEFTDCIACHDEAGDGCAGCVRTPIGDWPLNDLLRTICKTMDAPNQSAGDIPHRFSEHDITDAVRNGFGELAKVVYRDGGCLIITEFAFSDGDCIMVRLISLDNGWAFTDDGQTVGWMTNHMFTYTESRKRILEKTVNSEGGMLEGGRIGMGIDDDPCFALTRIIGIMLRASELLAFSRRNVRNAFMDDLRRTFSEGCGECEFNRKVVSGRGEEFVADVYVDGPRPVAVFGVGTRGRCKDAVIAAMALSEERAADIVVVIDERGDIPGRDLRMIEGRADAVMTLSEARARMASGGLTALSNGTG